MKGRPPAAGGATGAATPRKDLIRRIKTKWSRPRTTNAPHTFVPAIIGDPQESVVRVIAFSAGGADNVFQFGMVHAFLVSDAPRPHIVAGTSCGAVVAAMLADVLQAGELHKDPAARRLAQTAKFRELLAQ